MHFLNVDLEIEADFDLKPFVEAIESKLTVLYSGEGSSPERSLAAFETAVYYSDPKETLIEFCRVLEVLSEELKEVWSRMERKEFDIGYGFVNGRKCSQCRIDSAVIQRIARLGASVVFTIYSQEQWNGNSNPRQPGK